MHGGLVRSRRRQSFDWSMELEGSPAMSISWSHASAVLSLCLIPSPPKYGSKKTTDGHKRQQHGKEQYSPETTYVYHKAPLGLPRKGQKTHHRGKKGGSCTAVSYPCSSERCRADSFPSTTMSHGTPKNRAHRFRSTDTLGNTCIQAGSELRPARLTFILLRRLLYSALCCSLSALPSRALGVGSSGKQNWWCGQESAAAMQGNENRIERLCACTYIRTVRSGPDQNKRWGGSSCGTNRTMTRTHKRSGQ